MAKPDPASPGNVGKYLGAALVVPIATFVGYGMGYGVDLLFHTGWIRYVFLVLGAIAGFIELFKDLSEGT